MIRQAVEMVASFVDNLSEPFRATSNGVKGLANDMAEGFTKSLKDMGTAIAGFLAAEKLLEFFKGAVEAAAKAELSIGQLRQSVNNAGQTFSDWSPKIQDAIDRVKKLSTFTDADLRDALTHMIAKSSDVQGSLNNLGLAADIAAYKHISLAEAGDLVGKAMTGNGRVFKDFGITAGTTAEKMQQLREKTHGYAVEDLQTLDGQLKAVSRSWEEMKVAIGNAIVTQGDAKDGTKQLRSAIEDLTPALAAIAGFFTHLFVVIVQSFKGVGEQWAVNLLSWKSQIELFVGNAIITFATLGSKALSWIPGIGKGVDAAAAAAIEAGGNMVVAATEIQARLAAAAQKGEESQTATVTDHANKRTAARTKEEEAAAKLYESELKAAVTATQNETAALLAEEKKIGDAWIKDFGDVMPKVVTEFRVKINDLTTDIAAQKAKQQEFADKALAAYRENNQEAGDLYNMEAEKIGIVIGKIQAQKEMYEKILPVYSLLGDLAADVTREESDPNPYIRLGSLNDLLERQILVRTALADSSREALEADKDILATKKAIKDAETLTLAPAGGMVALEKESKTLDAERLAQAQLLKQEADKRLLTEVAIAHAAVNLGAAMGIVDQQTASTLNSAIGIGEALAHGDMAGAITGFASVLASVFSDSKGAAIRALMTTNNERLAELTRINGKLVDQTDSGAKIQRVLDALEKTGGSMILPGQVGLNSGDVAANLIGAGGSWQDVVDLAKSLGIDLGKTNQEVSLALPQLLQALKGANFQTFGNDFQGNLDRASFNEGLTGGSLSLSDYQTANANTQGGGSPALAGLFANGPPTLAAVLSLAGQVDSLSNAQLGGLSRAQLRDSLTGIAGLLNAAAPSGAAPPSTATPTSYVPPSTSTYVPTNTSGTSFDLSPVVNAITSGFMTANGYLANIDRSTAALAADLTSGGLLTIVATQTQTAADLTTVNGG